MYGNVGEIEWVFAVVLELDELELVVALGAVHDLGWYEAEITLDHEACALERAGRDELMVFREVSDPPR